MHQSYNQQIKHNSNKNFQGDEITPRVHSRRFGHWQKTAWTRAAYPAINPNLIQIYLYTDTYMHIYFERENFTEPRLQNVTRSKKPRRSGESFGEFAILKTSSQVKPLADTVLLRLEVAVMVMEWWDGGRGENSSGLFGRRRGRWGSGELLRERNEARNLSREREWRLKAMREVRVEHENEQASNQGRSLRCGSLVSP